MGEPPLAYYRPYLPSDSEASDAESETWSRASTPRPENANPDFIDDRTPSPNFRELAQALSVPLAPAAGVSLTTDGQELRYQQRRLDPRTTFAPYTYVPPPKVLPEAPFTSPDDKPQYKDTGIKTTTTTSNVDSVIVLKSRDRDKTIWPFPTNCQLFLPRTYRNVVGFSIAQINFISAFYYFSIAKQNVAIQIYEKDRLLYNPASQPVITETGTLAPLTVLNQIREGSYNISQLLEELTIQLNAVPPFYDFVGGFGDFLTQFQVSGDLSINFNYPGDYYYNSLKKDFIKNPTRAQIVGLYYQNQYANQFTYTLSEVQVAYYYPVLKEALLDPTTDLDTYDFTGTGYIQPDLVNYILYQFQGISDPTVTIVVQKNIAQLDLYRLNHTFRYSLANQYVCSYNVTNNLVTIQSGNLNTSLVNLLTVQYNIYLNQQLAFYNMTAAYYNQLATELTQLLSVLQDMYGYLQINFANYFAVNYGTYSRSYYAQLFNTVYLANGIGAQGVAYTYDSNVVPRDNDLMNDFRTNPRSCWPNMKGLTTVEGQTRNLGTASQSFPASLNYPYSIAQCNINLSYSFINSAGKIYTDPIRQAGDIVTPIKAGTYTIFQFRSKYRQTLQVETLPRQYQWRYPATIKSAVYPRQAQLFDASYCFVAPGMPATPNVTTARIVPTYAQYPAFNATPTPLPVPTYANRDAKPQISGLINIGNYTGVYYSFTPPRVTTATGAQITGPCTYQFSITIGSADTQNLVAFFYHDLAAFSADAGVVYTQALQATTFGVESDLFYKKQLLIPKAVPSVTYTFTAYAGQTYYILLRPDTISPDAVAYTIQTSFTQGLATQYIQLSFDTSFYDPSQPPIDPAQLLTIIPTNYNVAIEADPNFIRLPIFPSTLWGSNPSSFAVNKVTSNILTPIGYDANNVSNDLTDYIPFFPNNIVSTINPAATVCIDPITNYVFQNLSPYDFLKNTYFYTGSQNAILTSSANSRYSPGQVAARSYKIANYYATTYFMDGSTTLSYSPADIAPYPPNYTNATSGGSIPGYAYTNNNLILGAGVCGFMFVPASGTWAFDRLTFKTNFVNPLASANKFIHALGIFATADIYTSPATSINLKNALAVCLRTQINTYTPENLNLGFEAMGGSYYTFSTCTNLAAANPIIAGFDQNAKEFIGDQSGYYSVLAFNFAQYDVKDASGNIVGDSWTTKSPTDITNLSPAALQTLYTTKTSLVPIQNLLGSPIAYPYANTPFASNTFYDGTAAPTGQGMVLSGSNGNSSIFGPAAGLDESVSQYAQSIPVVNSHLHYLLPANIISNPNGFRTFNKISSRPTYVYSSVPNYMLMQDNAFVIMTYKTQNAVTPTSTPLNDFALKGTIAIQQIYPDYEATSIIAVSGNASNYCFLGASNIPGTGMSQLRFKLYDPASGILTELPINPQYTFSNSLLVQRFVFGNNRRWFLSSADVPAGKIILQGDTKYSFNTAPPVARTYTGVLSELQMDPDGGFLYLGISPTVAGFTTMSMFSLNSADPGYILTSSYQVTLETNVDFISGKPLPSSYKQIAVTLNGGIEEVLLTNTSQSPYTFYKIRNYVATASPLLSNTYIDESVQILDASPVRIMGGANGSKWLMLAQPPYMLGNRNDAYDAPTSLNIAWQLMFPTVKIEMRKLTNGTNPIIDLKGLDYPEYPHTAMFAYNSYSNLKADILGIDVRQGKWGNESTSNFMVNDVTNNGYYFNSYCMNIPLLPNYDNGALHTTTAPNDYYLAVRGLVPTENFQTMLRFYLPNRYDFGYARFVDISGEISTCVKSPADFTIKYAQVLTSFNSNFTFASKNFGNNPSQSFSGYNISSVGFGDFIGNYRDYYSTFSTNTVILSSINGTVKAEMNKFISTNLKYILPSSAITRQRFTDPLLFEIQWSTQLAPTFETLTDQWGLGWNLGYGKYDTGFATLQKAASFYKIQDDFIYLRLNPEFNINRMDAGGLEKYATTREPTGVTNQYYCKLLLVPFGGNATTFIHNPITFTPPIFALSKLYFQWYNSAGVLIANADAEWDMVVNIKESYDLIPIPQRKIQFRFSSDQNLAFLPSDQPLTRQDMDEPDEDLGTPPDKSDLPVSTPGSNASGLPATIVGGVNEDYAAWLAFRRRYKEDPLAFCSDLSPPDSQTKDRR